MLFGIRGLVDGIDPFLQLVDIFMGQRGLKDLTVKTLSFLFYRFGLSLFKITTNRSLMITSLKLLGCFKLNLIPF
jgi:hypothetical protein